MPTLPPQDTKTPTLSLQEIKILDQSRQRLSQLTNSLASLQQQILNSDPLPPWSSLQSLSQIISQNLASVSTQLTTHADVLSSINVYPVPIYPGREQEPLLNQLLRKKLEPHVEDWVEEGRAAGENLEDREEVTELWQWAMMAANEEARKHEWDGAEYTLEEREMGVENVVTGLRRGVYEESSSDEEEEEEEGGEKEKIREEEAGDKKPMAIDDLLRFLVKGEDVVRQSTAA